MTPSSAAAAALIEELVTLDQQNPLGDAVRKLGPTQQAVYEDDSKWRLFRAPNKSGKTSIISIEAWLDLMQMGRRDDMPTHRPPTLIYSCPDLSGSYADDVCRSLREYEPEGWRHPTCTYTRAKGYYVGGRRGLMTYDGGQVMFRSGHQAITDQAGIWGDKIFVNEPPEEKAWGELVRAAALMDAPIMMGFTAIGDLGWLKDMVEARDSKWSQHVGELTVEDCPWRTQESIDNQIALCPPSEREQRIYAGWDAPSLSRMYTGFDATITSDVLPQCDVSAILGLDHGEAPGHEAIVLGVAWRPQKGEAPHVHILDEYVSPGRTTVGTDAKGIVKMLERWGLATKDIVIAVGDVGSAGKSRLVTLNREFEIALKALTGWSPSIRTARKKKGSPEYEAHMVDTAMIEGRYHITTRCKGLTKSYSRWQGTRIGKDGEHSHLLDAARYVASPILTDTDERASMIQIG